MRKWFGLGMNEVEGVRSYAHSGQPVKTLGWDCTGDRYGMFVEECSSHGVGVQLALGLCL